MSAAPIKLDLSAVTEGIRVLVDSFRVMAEAAARAKDEIWVLSDEAMQEFVAELDFIRDPDSDMRTIRIVEEHYGVTHA